MDIMKKSDSSLVPSAVLIIFWKEQNFHPSSLHSLSHSSLRRKGKKVWPPSCVCEFSFFVQPPFFAIPWALEQKCAILMALFLIQKSAWEMPQQTTFCTQDFLVPLLHGLSLFSAVKQDHFIPFASIENCLKFALFRLLIRVSPFRQM